MKNTVEFTEDEQVILDMLVSIVEDYRAVKNPDEKEFFGYPIREIQWMSLKEAEDKLVEWGMLE